MIVEEPPKKRVTWGECDGEIQGEDELLLVSAKSDFSLKEQCRKLAEFCENACNLEISLGDVARTLMMNRTHFSGHRVAVTANSLEDAAKKLRAVAAEKPKSPVAGQAPGANKKTPRVAFLFPGQGAQYPGMAKGLYDAIPAFKEHFDECSDVLKDSVLPKIKNMSDFSCLFLGNRDVSKVQDIFTMRQDSKMSATQLQLSIFAVEYALSRTLMDSWGVRPDIVGGHSLGEYTAACIGGAMSLDRCLLAILCRSVLMETRSPAGPNGMLSVSKLSEGKVTEFLEAWNAGDIKACIKLFEGEKLSDVALKEEMQKLFTEVRLKPDYFPVSIATVNSHEDIVLSGPKVELDLIQKLLQQASVQARPVAVQLACHSEAMAEPSHRLVEILKSFPEAKEEQKPSMRILSNVSGKWHNCSETGGIPDA